MKILYVVHGLPPKELAGTEIVVQELSQSISRLRDWKFSRKHQVFIFYRNITDKDPYKAITRKEGNVRLISINTPWDHFRDFEKEYQNHTVDEIFESYLWKIKPDIVHVHHLIGLSSDIIQIVKDNDVPLIMTVHDFWYLCRRGQLITPDLHRCETIDFKECERCFIKHEEPEKLKKVSKRWSHMMNLLNQADLLISPSRFLRKVYIRNGISPERIIYSDNGINKKPFRFLKKNRSRKTRFGFLGTFIETKGVEILIDAFKRLGDPKTQLDLYGFFPPTAQDYKKKIIEKIRDQKNITFHGKYHPRDIAKILSNIDCLVVPSLWYENSPLTIHESYLAKTPVIASDLGGMSEYVKDKKTGFLFKPGDEEDLAKKMDGFIRNKDKIRFDFNTIKIKSIQEDAKELIRIYTRFNNLKKDEKDIF